MQAPPHRLWCLGALDASLAAAKTVCLAAMCSLLRSHSIDAVQPNPKAPESAHVSSVNRMLTALKFSHATLLRMLKPL